MTRLLVAVGALVASFLLGTTGASLLRRRLEKPTNKEQVRQLAPAVSSFVMWSFLAFGLLVAVSMASPGTLDTIPGDLVAYFPKAIVAGALILLANVAAQLVSVAVGQAAMRSTGKANTSLVRAVRTSILVSGILLAVSQLGVNTTLVNLVVSAGLFGAAAAAALLVGLGGRDMANNVAAGRYLKKLVNVGDELVVGEVSGVVTAIHAASIEVMLGDGAQAHVPAAKLLAGIFELRRGVAGGIEPNA